MAPRKKNASRPSAESTHSFGGAVDTLRHARTGHGGGGEQPTRDKAKDTRREEALIYGRPIVDTGRRETPPAVPSEEASAPAPSREEQHRSSRNTRCRGEGRPRQLTWLTVTGDRSLRRYAAI
ncbi:unnamed protein product, partial [Ixodes persulcatus]